jgi:hypothetical protein
VTALRHVVYGRGGFRGIQILIERGQSSLESVVASCSQQECPRCS